MGWIKSVAVVGNSNYEKHIMGEINEKQWCTYLIIEINKKEVKMCVRDIANSAKRVLKDIGQAPCF
jgi:hypothetical protein